MYQNERNTPLTHFAYNRPKQYLNFIARSGKLEKIQMSFEIMWCCYILGMKK